VVKLSAVRVDTTPRVFSDIHLNFVITGNNISTKHVDRAVSLSADKYCSVAFMLNKAVNITHDFTIEAGQR
jgi:putative redox protein